MKIKTSVSLSEDVVAAIDEIAGERNNRSEFIEAAVRAYIAQILRQRQNARDQDIINERADALNEEALDALTYQAMP
ncbi:MAG: ribbon-helix-helix domain-containing protein [Anaerolineae bacterium]